MRRDWREVLDAATRIIEELAPSLEQEEDRLTGAVETVLQLTHDEAHAAREEEKRAQAKLIVDVARATKKGAVCPVLAARKALADAAFLDGTLSVERRKADAVLRHGYAAMLAEVEAGTSRVAAGRLAAEIAAVVERENAELARLDTIDHWMARAQSARRGELVRRLGEVRERILAVSRELDAILS